MSRRTLTTGTITTDGSGDAVSTITVAEARGALIHQIEVVDTDLDATADVTIKIVNKDSGVEETILTLTNFTASKVHRPRTLEHDNVGGDLTTYTLYQITGDIEVTIAQGGDTKTGAVYVDYIWN